MGRIAILDCTLRDGGYLVNKQFSDNFMYGIINGLTDAGLEFVEIGFLQDDISKEESTVFQNSEMARRWIPQKRKNTLYTVLADYSRYSVSNLDIYDGKSFDAVRACFFKHERKDVLDFSRVVIEKGYKLFIQPVDILGYQHIELLDLINDINQIEPECFSIVDTFGSMYLDDLRTAFNIIHHNLNPEIKIGFHSHNNLQMSSALSQEFLTLSQKRDVVVDATCLGMGRGAGNTPTELIVQYVNAKMGGAYNLDAILDVIDSYMMSIKMRCSWGYDIPMFLSGCYSSHVNNVSYLLQKPSLRFADLRFILNELNAQERRRYDFGRLEELYLEYMRSDIDDTNNIERFKAIVQGKTVLVVTPGKSVVDKKEAIEAFIERECPLVIAVNFIPTLSKTDYLYFNNLHRYDYWKRDRNFNAIGKILTSNVMDSDSTDFVISFHRLVKTGWNNLDNSIIMLLRLLNMVDVERVALAGFDGFNPSTRNYAVTEMENNGYQDYAHTNIEIERLFTDFLKTTKINDVFFITPSRFEYVEGVRHNDDDSYS
ncbi:MAG: aldolase catalytic domain-containing protein [Treponema sp.]|nr:aldolase catalytic domain-containing protein [Treponema sp.]